MVAAMIAASAIAHGRNGGAGIKRINKRAANAPLDLIVVRIDVVYIEARSKLSRTIEFCVVQAQRCSLPGEYRMGTFDSSVPVAVQRERVSRREINVAGESKSGPAGCRAPAARSQSGHEETFNRLASIVDNPFRLLPNAAHLPAYPEEFGCLSSQRLCRYRVPK